MTVTGGYGEELRGGLYVNRLDVTTQDEINNHLMNGWRYRGPTYPIYASALMADYNPEFLKLHFTGTLFADFGDSQGWSRSDLLLWSVANLPSYVMYGWETGIVNEFFALWRFGMPKEQAMELVMFAQLYAGMRGLGHVYRAVGDFLPAYGPPKEPAEWPEGWEPDPEAFKSGLDLSTREMTKADLENLTGWYERNIGYVPKSIQFGLKYHPEFVKVNRAKWEVAIRTLPKQCAPYVMLRMNAVSQNREGIREAALLCKAWGIKRKFVIQLLNGVVYYFAGFEGFYAPADVLEEILDNWE